jgi:peptidoglycan/LPS O-acetylase OafA/YrhL
VSELQRFRTDIQGLRALAVVPVVLFHADESLIPGGFVGVDIFFVLSGFLITRILVRELNANSFSIIGFYERRVRRLFPALFLMFAAALAASLAILPPGDLVLFADSAIAATLFLSNVHFFLTTDYFADAANLRPLLHTWSLAVEEQFYLAFPIVLFLCHKYARRWLKPLLWVAALASFVLSLWLVQQAPTAAFYLPFGRAYELLIGSLLAVGAVPYVRSARVLDALTVVGLLAIVISMVVLSERTPFPGAAALLPCLGTALVLYGGEGRTSLGGRLISNKAFLFFGAISYSLYLWHWPILVFARYLTLGSMSVPAIIAAVMLSVLLAWLSFRFVEQPVLKSRLRAGPLLTGGAALMASAVAAFALLHVTNGLPGRFDAGSHRMFATAADRNPLREQCHTGDGREVPYAMSCPFGAADAVPSVAVWGDSFGAEIVVEVGERLKPLGGAVRQLTASGCPPSLGFSRQDRLYCEGYNTQTYEALLADPDVKTVVMAANYHGYAEEDRPTILAGIKRAARGLSAAGKHVVLVEPIPRLPFPGPRALALASVFGRDTDTIGFATQAIERENAPYTRVLRQLAPEIGGETIPVIDVLCDGPHCAVQSADGRVLYFDDVHLSLAGSAYLLDTYDPDYGAWLRGQRGFAASTLDQRLNRH